MNLCLAHAKSPQDQFWLQQRNFSCVTAQGDTVSLQGWPLAGVGQVDILCDPSFCGVMVVKDASRKGQMTNNRDDKQPRAVGILHALA